MAGNYIDSILKKANANNLFRLRISLYFLKTKKTESSEDMK